MNHAGPRWTPGECLRHRVLRALLSITLGLAVMSLAAYAFGSVSRTEWVWWLAPLTVALDGSLLFRARARGSAAVLPPAELGTVSDPVTSVYLVWSLVAAGAAAWGAYTGNRLAIILGAAVAIVGRAVRRDEERAFDYRTEQPN